MLNLRKQFFECLTELAKHDKKIIFVTGDLGFSYMESYQKKFPNQFINAGCLECSITGICAGLSLGGYKPYFYSTIPFVLFRNYEFVRDDICYNNTNVKLAGVAMSGFIGFTHEIAKNEDIKVLKGLPNIKIYIPKNEKELKKAMQESYEYNGPCYIRI